MVWEPNGLSESWDDSSPCRKEAGIRFFVDNTLDSLHLLAVVVVVDPAAPASAVIPPSQSSRATCLITHLDALGRMHTLAFGFVWCVYVLIFIR